MNRAIQYVVETTITAIVVFWVITNAASFSNIANATQTAVVGSVRALWGGNYNPGTGQGNPGRPGR